METFDVAFVEAMISIGVSREQAQKLMRLFNEYIDARIRHLSTTCGPFISLPRMQIEEAAAARALKSLDS